MSLPAEPSTLNPNVGQDEIAQIIAGNLFSTLVALDADARVIPDLARSWDVTRDGRTYTFHLHPTARWHDGRLVTAADVRWALTNIASSEGLGAPVAQRISGIETRGDHTVVIQLKESWAPFLAQLALFGTYIVPRHASGVTDWGGPSAKMRVVGSGPFRFAEWTPGRRIVLHANPEYFRPGPYVDRLVYLFARDAEHTANLLANGAVHHAIARLGREQYERLKASADVEVQATPTTSRLYIGINLRKALLSDLRVRRALNMAVNRAEVVHNAMLGLGAPALGFFTPAIAWAYNGEARVPDYDPDAARALLDRAGVPTRWRVSLIVPRVAPYEDVARELRRQFARVGIDLRLDMRAPADYIAGIVQRRDFDLLLAGGSLGPDPDMLRDRFSASGRAQSLGYNSPELDAALDDGAHEMRVELRARAYFRAQEILARDLPIVPLAETVRLSAFRRGVVGLSMFEARGLVADNVFSLVRVAEPRTASDHADSPAAEYQP